ncbi:pheromone-processing carboxypeptidase KEX1-like [Nylanderia fulva]|uniref:pheromone-processing carboxypeptidase KEX1-like n=1 Tax=Nylanderia fulva TaxID=613905 RepID=UPI0010FB4531|nr:pheromone-processing carboxypeptidase KEX1-like [Nylanderia fulva]
MTQNADETTKPKFHLRFQSSEKEHISNRCHLASIKHQEARSRTRQDEADRSLVTIHHRSNILEVIHGNCTTEGEIADGGLEIEEFSETQENMQQLKMMLLRQASNLTESGNETVTTTRPCECQGGVCGCCSRILYDRWKQKACVNITYDPDEFSFTAHILMNDRVLYTRTVSGKNPRPICVPFPRIPFMRACVKFYNIYFQGRNIHLCVNMEGKFEDTTVFKVSLDCLRFGENGLALLKPEDGGGLGQVEVFPDDDNDDEDDYDDENEDNDEDDGNDDDDDDDDDDIF